MLKIEPQAQTEQNVTMFPVLVRIDNKEGLLRPGMNAEVEVHVGRREDVLTVPNAALRTQRDVGSAAQVLGLSPEQVQQTLAAEPAVSGAKGQQGGGTVQQQDSGTAGQTSGGTVGQTSQPASATRGRRASSSAPRPRGPAALNRYIVFVRRNGQPTPVWIRTGLTDLDHSEVLEGLTESDSVFVLPSASLVQSQQESRERINRITGGGGVPGMQQQQAPAGAARP